ncbi:MAG: hypothetical protein PHS17_16180 [Desulfobacterales bacterium]|nr:hypothetical protein [Desulfobacterales bacterium]
MPKTALELTPEERKKYRLAEVLRARKKKKDRKVDLLRQEAWQVARKASEILRKDYGASKVAIFGSLVHEGAFGLWSDIDVATWGVRPEEFYSAVGAVTGLSPLFKVDVVDVEECRSTLREIIEREGIEI